MQKKKKKETENDPAVQDVLEEKTDIDEANTDLLHEQQEQPVQQESVEGFESPDAAGQEKQKKIIKQEAEKNIKLKKKLGHEAKTNRWGYVFVAPFILAFCIFNFWPTINTFIVSFTDLRGLREESSFVSDCQRCNGKGYTVQQTGYVIERNGKVFLIEQSESQDEYIDLSDGEVIDEADGYLLVRIGGKYVVERSAGFSKERYVIEYSDGKYIAECFGKKFIIQPHGGEGFLHESNEGSIVERGNGYTILRDDDVIIVQNRKGSYLIEMVNAVDENEKFMIVFNGSIFMVEQPHEDCSGSGRIVNIVRNYTKLFGFSSKWDPAQNKNVIKANDPDFWGALGNTFIIWGFNFLPQLGIALILSIWLSDARLNLAGKGLFRAIIYMPNLLTAASVALLFRSIFGFNGYPVAPANQFLRAFDIEAIDFFRNVGFSRGLVAFIQWWMWYGHTLIMLMAGITSIPVSLYESATVDGANSRQTAWFITLPLLRPMMLYILITSMIGGMQMFDIPLLLTNQYGSPGNSIRTTSVYQYNTAFMGINDYAYGASISIGIFFVTIILAMLIFFFMQDRSDIKRKKKGGAA